MIAHVYAKSAATKPQILMLFALILAFSSVVYALPIPHSRWIGALLSLCILLVFGGFTIRRTLVVYEYCLFPTELVIRRHLFKWVRTTVKIPLRLVTEIHPASRIPASPHRIVDVTASYGGIVDNRFFVFFRKESKSAALLMECGYPFAKSMSKAVLNQQTITQEQYKIQEDA